MYLYLRDIKRLQSTLNTTIFKLMLNYKELIVVKQIDTLFIAISSREDQSISFFEKYQLLNLTVHL